MDISKRSWQTIQVNCSQPETEDMMSLDAHLAELSEKHRVLERRIAQEQSRPGSSDQEIRQMKLEKLRLKEEISKLQTNRRPH